MEQRKRSSKYSILRDTGLVLLLLTSFIAPSTLTQAASTSAFITGHDQSTHTSAASSENIIRSIGFRNCVPNVSSGSDSTGEDNSSAIRLSSLALLYDGEFNTISMRAEGSTDREFDATAARVLLTAYDRVFYDQKIDFAKIAFFIPRFKGKFSFQETFPAPSLLPEQLPKQLFSLPAVEALASIQLYDSQGNPILCTSVPLINAVSAHSPVITVASVSLTAAAIALTAVSNILAALTSAAVLTSMPLAAAGGGMGDANPSNGLSPSVWDVVSFCQFISMSGSLNLEYPELLKQWAQNFAWSMGLVPSESWNRAINGLRLRTSSEDSNNDEAHEVLMFSKTHLPPAERILYSGNVNGTSIKGKATNTTATAGAHGNETVTALSMQSVMDGAVKSFVEKAGYNPSTTQAAATAIARREPSRSMSSSAVFSAGAQQLNRRQTAPAVAPGKGLLPSPADSSLMNRIGDLPNLKAMSASLTPTMSPQLTPPASWPGGEYHTSTGSLTQHGLTSFGESLDIPAKNMFMTSLFLFLILLLATSLLALVLRIALEGYAYVRPGKFTKFRRRFSSYYLGNMLRVVLLAYFAVATMAFHQLTFKDSWPITMLAAMTLLLFLALVIYITLRLRRAGGTSLFFDERLKSKYGALYDQYVLSAYWFFVPVLVYQILKAAIVGLGQGRDDDNNMHHRGSSDGWAQTSLLLMVEVSFAALMIWKKPFADKTPNRLNGILGCVRVLNVVLLAALIEGTTVSTVSRTVVGVIITGTQALMILVLAILVLYQLGRALWRLWSIVKAKKDKNRKKNKNRDPLDYGEMLVVSVKDDKTFDGDHEDGEPTGRTASERSRPGDESMTSLVGMMGIGSNPTIRCTPASDDEDGDFIHSDYEKDVIPGRYQKRDPGVSMPAINNNGKPFEGVQESIRDSTQSTDSQSSFILDYYNLSYLPVSIRSKVLKEQQSRQEPAERNEENADGFNVDPEIALRQDGFTVSSLVPTEPWVQSAYMTRRSSESNMYRGRKVKVPSPRQDNDDSDNDSDDDYMSELRQQRYRRRPMSLGMSVQGLGPITFSKSESRSQRGDSLPRRAARPELFPSFRGTYIPDSLLAGPPPPSAMGPRRGSISSATLVTPPSMSPVLASPSDVDAQGTSSLASLELDTTISVQLPVPVSAAAPTLTGSSSSASFRGFEEYRFPDEGFGRTTQQRLADQRAVHPLSPLHPDYQHPDDLYDAKMPSPNEDGPTMSFKYVNVPNAPQDGYNSRRQRQSLEDDTVNAPQRRLTVPSTPTRNIGFTVLQTMRRPIPPLRIVTTPKAVVPPPQIAIPTLPLTPFSASLTNAVDAVGTAATEGAGEGRAQKFHHEQLTPVSSVCSNASLKESKTLTLDQEPNIGGAMTVGGRKRSYSNLVKRSLAESPRLGGSSPSRQRALSTTRLPVPIRPLTTSSAHRDARAAR